VLPRYGTFRDRDQQVPGVADGDHKKEHDQDEQTAEAVIDVLLAERVIPTPTKHRALRPNLEISTPGPIVRVRLILKPSTAGRTTSPRLRSETPISHAAVARASSIGAKTTSATRRTTTKSASVTRARLLMSE